MIPRAINGRDDILSVRFIQALLLIDDESVVRNLKTNAVAYRRR